VEIGRIMVAAQPRQKFYRTPISTNGWVQRHMPVILAMWGSINRRIAALASLGIKQDPI
jgi:hypothetical protein